MPGAGWKGVAHHSKSTLLNHLSGLPEGDLMVEKRGSARKVHKLPSLVFTDSRVVVTNVLILAREDIIAALLGLLVELRGFHPLYAKTGESAEHACERTACRKIVIDCDHSAYSAPTLTTLKDAGIRVILFSPSRIDADVQDAARKNRFPTFTLPIGPEAFGRLLDA
jgi:hypothetical protein